MKRSKQVSKAMNISFLRIPSIPLASLITLAICLSGAAVLLATSPSDIPSVDAVPLELKLASEQSTQEILITYENGPFGFESYPLLLDILISHEEPSEDFKFDQQSWTITSQGVDGEERRQLVVVTRGRSNIFYVDQEKLTINGNLSLFGCPQEAEVGGSSELCIPCKNESDRCEFVLTLTREGEPYPAELVEVNASHWATEGAKFTLKLSER